MMTFHRKLAVFAAASLLFPFAAAAQLVERPKPNQAPLILSALDTDGDDKISQSEAPDRLKQNFAIVDRDGDGLIDAAELKAALAMAAGQRQSDRSGALKGGEIEAELPISQPSFGTINTKQVMRMRSLSPDEDRPFYMLNLIKYRKRAVYRDGRVTALTGRQANNLYSPIKFLAEIGAKIAYLGAVTSQQEGSRPQWESVAIVKYPSRAKFFEMTSHKDFQSRSVHKDAGIELSQVVVTERVPRDPAEASLAIPAKAPQPATKGDSPFVLCHLVKYREEAQSPNGQQELQQSGREARERYQEAAAGVLRDVGAKTILRLNVEGVFIGDGREWSECRLIQFPSQRAFQEAEESSRLQNVRRHRSDAIEDSYTLRLRTQFDLTAQIDETRPVTTK